MTPDLSGILESAQRRWLLWNLLRATAASAGICAAVTYLDADWLWCGFCFVCFGCAWVMRPSARDLPAMMDRAGQLDGLIECAFDNRNRDNPTIHAQRRQALEAAQKMPLSAYVPTPSPAWALPVLVFGLTTIFQAQSDSWVTASELEVSSHTAQEQSAVSGDTAQQTGTQAAPSTGDARSSQRQPEADDNEVRGAGVGRKTGDTGGGDSGRREVSRYEKADGSIQLAEPFGVRKRSSHTSEDAIAEPARPFPSKYQSVIADWFNRSVQ